MADSFTKVIDNAIQALVYAKFKNILGINNFQNDTVFYPKEVAFRHLAEKRGNASLEFISIWRESSEFSWERNRSAVSRKEILLGFVDPISKKNVVSVKAIPIDMSYNIWFWTKDKDKLNKIIEEYLWWIHEDPNLNLNYNDLYPMEMDLHFGEITDESDVPSMFDKGLYFVLKAPIKIDAWVMKGTEERVIHKVVISVYDEKANRQNPELLERNTLVLYPGVPYQTVPNAPGYGQLALLGTVLSMSKRDKDGNDVSTLLESIQVGTIIDVVRSDNSLSGGFQFQVTNIESLGAVLNLTGDTLNSYGSVADQTVGAAWSS